MTPAFPELVGQRVGEYDVVAKLGVEGGTEIYEARQPVVGMRVALRILPTDLADEARVEAFLTATRAVNALAHPGIGKVLSFGQLPDGRRYAITELLRGQSLEAVIRERAPVPPDDALVWVDEVLEALEVVHAAGVVHGALRPAHLFLADDGRGRRSVQLLNFGLSGLAGTIEYLSPEQALGHPSVATADLYAVGCILFELLTGRVAFEAGRSPASSVNPSLGRTLDGFVASLLEQELASRPSTAKRCREALHDVRLGLVLEPSGERPAVVGPEEPGQEYIPTKIMQIPVEPAPLDPFAAFGSSPPASHPDMADEPTRIVSFAQVESPAPTPEVPTLPPGTEPPVQAAPKPAPPPPSSTWARWLGVVKGWGSSR